jgi:hypothetical protein
MTTFTLESSLFCWPQWTLWSVDWEVSTHSTGSPVCTPRVGKSPSLGMPPEYIRELRKQTEHWDLHWGQGRNRKYGHVTAGLSSFRSHLVVNNPSRGKRLGKASEPGLGAINPIWQQAACSKEVLREGVLSPGHWLGAFSNFCDKWWGVLHDTECGSTNKCVLYSSSF